MFLTPEHAQSLAACMHSAAQAMNQEAAQMPQQMIQHEHEANCPVAHDLLHHLQLYDAVIRN